VTQIQTHPLFLGRATAILRKGILWQEISLIGNKQAEKVPCGMVVTNNLLRPDKVPGANPYVAAGVDTQSGKIIRGQFYYV